MKKLYLLLDNELKLCIIVDRCIILYKEYEYTESILDQLYSKIAAHNVMKQLLLQKEFLANNSLMKAIKCLALASGIQNIIATLVNLM